MVSHGLDMMTRKRTNKTKLMAIPTSRRLASVSSPSSRIAGSRRSRRRKPSSSTKDTVIPALSYSYQTDLHLGDAAIQLSVSFWAGILGTFPLALLRSVRRG
jgi:hypothetical protein